jgi:RNA polymerase sigma-70 factor (ECF subfamily)
VAAASPESSLDRLKRRETEAWALLFEEHHPLVFRAVLAQVGNREVAEDIAGQVFVEALEGIRRYHDRGKPIAAWLLTIARHRSIDWLRRQGRERTGALPETAVPAHTSGEDTALQALAGLTPDQREVVFLRFVEGYPLQDIARLTNRSVGAVKALQHRALQQLRGILEATNEVSQ